MSTLVDLRSNSEPGQELDEKIQELNDRLEQASHGSTNRAFNLGCSIGFLPALMVTALAYYLLNRSLVGALLTALVTVLGIVAFATMAAYLSRARTIQRVYKNDILPQIGQILASGNLTRQEFDRRADSLLPQHAVLRMYLAPDAQDDRALESQPHISNEKEDEA